ncbi:MAG TPA: hypothetical protein VGW33_13845 [Terriglobia bacterium]|nr:hypothetical protein [Terriglobia bacterium]
MSLRKSPVRTPALLAANRANAQKSTGPRTAAGKRHAGLNGLRHGLRAEKLFAFLARADAAWFDRLPPPDHAAPPPSLAGFGGPPPYNLAAHPYTAFFQQAGRDRQDLLGIYRALYVAFLPDPASDGSLGPVRRLAAYVWVISRQAHRRARSRAWRDANLAPGGALPQAWRQSFARGTGDGRRGWRVTVSIWLRRGRGRASDPPVISGYDWQEGRASLHAGVTITTGIRHPQLGYKKVWDVPAGEAWRMVLPMKPESSRKPTRFHAVIPDSAGIVKARMEARRRAEEVWGKLLCALAERKSGSADPLRWVYPGGPERHERRSG